MQDSLQLFPSRGIFYNTSSAHRRSYDGAQMMSTSRPSDVRDKAGPPDYRTLVQAEVVESTRCPPHARRPSSDARLRLSFVDDRCRSSRCSVERSSLRWIRKFSAIPVVNFSLSTCMTNGRDRLDHIRREQNRRHGIRTGVRTLPLGRPFRVPSWVEVIHSISFVELSRASPDVVNFLFPALRSYTQMLTDLRVDVAHHTLSDYEKFIGAHPRLRFLMRLREHNIERRINFTLNQHQSVGRVSRRIVR